MGCALDATATTECCWLNECAITRRRCRALDWDMSGKLPDVMREFAYIRGHGCFPSTPKLIEQVVERIELGRHRRPVYDIQTESGQYLSNNVIVHNCFIQSVTDDLVNAGGIMDLWTREARLFKYGSGTGSNFSKLRGENEPLSAAAANPPG